MQIQQKTVQEIQNLIVQSPSILHSNDSVKCVFEKLVEDTRTRHIYVLNDKNKMVGSIRLNELHEFIFPYIQILENINFNKFMKKFSNLKAKDIMETKFYYTNKNDFINTAIDTMLKNKLNEIPVLNNNYEIVGELNLLEIIQYFTNNFYKVDNHRGNIETN